MAVKINTLNDLLMSELQDLYNAENQIVKSLPDMVQAASNSELKAAFRMHLEETKGHVQRLEQVFQHLGKKAEGKTCEGMKGLLKEGSEIATEDAAPEVRDAGLIVAAQKVEHYEIAAYGSLCVFAGLLGMRDVKSLLKQNMSEEEATDKKLTSLAESTVNVEALSR